ncbi:MAG: hypothetical protein JRH20_31075 [Deltaproteobacteria bacterium]|nr:hypothetical protein [Deltaproteobacteria bacterium]
MLTLITVVYLADLTEPLRRCRDGRRRAGLAAIWRWRSRTAGLSLAATTAHLALQSGWIPTPTSTDQLGVISLIIGFVLLGVGVLLNALWCRSR